MAYTPKLDWDDAPPQTPDTSPKAADANRWEKGIDDAHAEITALNAAMADVPDTYATKVALAEAVTGEPLEITDGVVDAILSDPASASSVTLLATYAPGAQVPGGQPGGAQGDDGINVKTGYAGNKIAADLSGCFVAGGAGPGYDNVIGNGIIANIGTGTPNAPANDADLLGTNANISAILGGYDNVAAGLASIISAFHCYTTTAATHGTISGGSYHGIDAGDYNTIGGGTLNKILAGVNSTIAGGRQGKVEGAGNNAIVGGILNEINGQASTAGGSTNKITGNFSTAFGALNTVTANEGSAIGRGNTVSGNSSSALGRENTATATYTTAIGYGSAASAQSSTAIGHGAKASAIGQIAFAGGVFTSPGDSQFSVQMMRRQTTDATVQNLLNQFSPQVNSTFAYTVTVIAKEHATGDTASWRFEGVGKRESGTTVTLVGGVPTPTTAADPGASAWVATLLTGSGSLNVRVTGEVDKTIRWVAKFESTELVTA